MEFDSNQSVDKRNSKKSHKSQRLGQRSFSDNKNELLLNRKSAGIETNNSQMIVDYSPPVFGGNSQMNQVISNENETETE